MVYFIAGVFGGAMYVAADAPDTTCNLGSDCAVLIRNSTFALNSAEQAGAVGMEADQMQLSIIDSLFDSNTATGSSGDGGGGAVVVTSQTYGVRTNGLKAVNSTFSSNSALGKGGSLYLTDLASAVLDNCTIANSSGSWGGGLCIVSQCNAPSRNNPADSLQLRPPPTFDCQVQLTGVVMHDNSATTSSGDLNPYHSTA